MRLINISLQYIVKLLMSSDKMLVLFFYWSAEYCIPLVRKGGLFVAAKGHDPQVSRYFLFLNGPTINFFWGLISPFHGMVFILCNF